MTFISVEIKYVAIRHQIKTQIVMIIYGTNIDYQIYQIFYFHLFPPKIRIIADPFLTGSDFWCVRGNRDPCPQTYNN